MYTKLTRHEISKTMSNAATTKIELPETGILSAIKLEFEAVNASAIHGANKARIVDRLTKIELTDGGTKTMFSLTGQCAKAAAFYATKEVPPETAILYGAKTQRTTIPLLFGDRVGDPQYALDLSAYDQVDLEITNDAGTTQWADLALKVDVQLLSMEDIAAKPAKYLKSYQWRSEKPSADGQYVRHQLPTTEKIKKYFVQFDPDLETVGSATHNPISDSYNFDFSFKERSEYVYKNVRPKDIARLNSLLYGRAITSGRYKQSTTQYFDLAIAYLTNTPASAIGDTASTVATAEAVLEDSNDRFSKMKNVSAGTSAPEMIDITAIGEGYYNTLMFFDAMSPSENMFLDAGKGGKGPIYLDWYGYKDDHTVKSCMVVPMDQGKA